MRWKNSVRAIFILVCLIMAAISAYLGQPYAAKNADVTLIIITVLAVFAGFLVAIIAILGDPALIPSGTWRAAEMRRENVEARLVTHTYLFIAYLIGIALLFIGALLEKAPDGDVPDGVKVWIERAYLFWGIFAFLLTFGLPTALLKLQIARYDAEIERRRAESGISEHNGDRKKQKPTRPKR